MSARTTAGAVSDFVAQVQQVIACSTQEVVSVGYRPASQPQVAVLNRGLPVRLPGARPLQFDLALQYTLVQRPREGLWSVAITGYIFAFGGQDGAEILAYHWHPGGTSRVTWPHPHIQGDIAGLILPRTHLPTGVVAVREVVRLAIEELGVQPRRADWMAVLERVRQSVEG